MEAESEIVKWYRGKVVFITGATGFMGKVLVEKLLRSCPDIGPIYVLMRDKKKILARDRVDEIMSSRVFEEVRAMRGDRKDWLFPILGDISLPDLGISAEDRHLLQEKVSVVFHVAATVRFDEPLRVAVATNLEGTKAMMQLCLGMTRLSAIVHVSTAYSNCNLSTIEERIYLPPADPDKVMHCVAGLDDDFLEIVSPRLVGNHPNTYTFTKALAEYVVAGYSSVLPIAVVRPSVVTGVWREPTPGWIDNFNGLTGPIAGASKGFLKSVYGKGHLLVDLIPVDVCINLFIVAAWEIGTREPTKLESNVRVYNCVSGPFRSLTWKELVTTVDSCIKKYAVSNVFASPQISMTDSRVKQTLWSIVQLTIPTILADTYIWLRGGKPRFQYYRRKLDKMASVLEFFRTHGFRFNVDNVKELKRRLNPADRVLFNCDVTGINWEEYITGYFLGIRKYVLNEKDETLPASKQHLLR